MEVKAKLEAETIRKIVIDDLMYSYALCTQPRVLKAIKRMCKYYCTKEEFKRLRFD